VRESPPGLRSLEPGGPTATWVIAGVAGVVASRSRNGPFVRVYRKGFVMSVDVFFDYTCGFSNRAQHWIAAVSDADVRWRPFSLLEQNRDGSGPPVFEQPGLGENVSLVALAVHEAVRSEGGNVDGYRRRMFAGWHDEPGRLSTQDIIGFGLACGLTRFDHDTAFAAVAAEHAEASQWGVFGTPTLVFGASQAAFVKLDAVPTADRAEPLWDSVRQLATAEPALREWQRVTAPETSR